MLSPSRTLPTSALTGILGGSMDRPAARSPSFIPVLVAGLAVGCGDGPGAMAHPDRGARSSPLGARWVPPAAESQPLGAAAAQELPGPHVGANLPVEAAQRSGSGWQWRRQRKPGGRIV